MKKVIKKENTKKYRHKEKQNKQKGKSVILENAC